MSEWTKRGCPEWAGMRGKGGKGNLGADCREKEMGWESLCFPVEEEGRLPGASTGPCAALVSSLEAELTLCAGY
jgi:hypothetical protein